MDIDLPPMPETALHAVPPDGARARFYPEIVEAFQALGFQRLGGVHMRFADPSDLEDLISAHPEEVRAELRASSQTPETVLADPDGTTFVGVDWFYRQPSVRLRTLLADGRLVETQRAWDHLPIQVVDMAPYVDRLRLRPEQDGSAPGRLFTMVPRGDAATWWAAHRAAVARSGGVPVQHSTVEQAVGLWRQVQAHDEAVALNVVPAVKRVLRLELIVPMVVLGLLVLSGILLAVEADSLDAAIPWWAAATAVAFGSALFVWLTAQRLPWWLRYRTSIRPRFNGSPH